jgi:hypothetical protein
MAVEAISLRRKTTSVSHRGTRDTLGGGVGREACSRLGCGDGSKRLDVYGLDRGHC